MKVRPATTDDMWSLINIGDLFYREGGFADRGLRIKDDDLGKFLLFLINSPNGILLVVEDNEVVIGTIGGIVNPWFLDFSQSILIENWFWVHPDHRNRKAGSLLLSEFEVAGKDIGVSHVCMVTLDSREEERLMGYYRSVGYAHLEHHFIKEIK